MHIFKAFLAAAFASGAFEFQQLLNIPEVEHDVSSMLNELQQFNRYRSRSYESDVLYVIILLS